MAGMWCSLFVSLLLAHLVGDFVLQTDSLCKQKREKKAGSPFLYVHAMVVSLLSVLAQWNLKLWYVALTIGISHLLIDLVKAYCKKDNVWVFVIDQVLHILVLIVAAWLCVNQLDWIAPDWLSQPVHKAESITAAALLCWKPANLFIKEILKYNQVTFPADDSSNFHAGKLIGTIERWLILVFILLGSYEVIGFLIAAKSIIRFRNDDRIVTEYFLAGTLLSIAIAVACGLLVKVA